MKQNYILLLMLLLVTSSCAAPTSTPRVDIPFVFPTDKPLPTRAVVAPTSMPTAVPASLTDIPFLTKFSEKKVDWQIISGAVTAAQINAEVARQEGDQVGRTNQKVINGFIRSAVKQGNGQVFEVLYPAELTDGKLTELTVKNVKQVPVLASHAALLEDYFAVNFPDITKKWIAQNATDADVKYAAIITVTWATKYGPLRISYKTTGKYVIETGNYPGRLEFLRKCMFEQTIEHFSPKNKLDLNWYPAPVIKLSGTTRDGVSGEMKSDAFGWSPMADFAKAESQTLSEIGDAVAGVKIESKETLAGLQAAFDKAFMPVYCTEAVIK
ncbi:MAG: hypothetical protein PHQ36_05065 [Anaerolineales bacterium]|nr:hypothetical protein [Anaerolineales bacterium]